jgi:hypothetical protein
LILDAIFYLVRGGIAWAQLPHDFPPYHTVYGIYGRWAKARRHGLAGLAGDRCGSGVVLAGFGGGVATNQHVRPPELAPPGATPGQRIVDRGVQH